MRTALLIVIGALSGVHFVDGKGDASAWRLRVCPKLRHIGLGWLCRPAWNRLAPTDPHAPPLPPSEANPSEVPHPRMLLSEGIVDIPLSFPESPTPGKHSYNESEVVGDLQGEITRLREQMDLSFGKEARISLASLKPHPCTQPRVKASCCLC